MSVILRASDQDARRISTRPYNTVLGHGHGLGPLGAIIRLQAVAANGNNPMLVGNPDSSDGMSLLEDNVS